MATNLCSVLIKKYTAHHPQELDAIAADLLKLVGSGKIWCFYGEMGAGKTTLIKSLVRHLGITENSSSPTFSIVNEYHDSNGYPVYHFDFYRLNKPEEALDFGVEEYFYSGQTCFLEWPEKIDNLLPSDCVKVQIELDQDNARKISLSR